MSRSVSKSSRPSKRSIQRRFKVVNIRSTRENPVADEDCGWWVLRDENPEFGPYSKKAEADECRLGQVEFEFECAKNGPSETDGIEQFADDGNGNDIDYDIADDDFEETMPDGGEIPVTSEEVAAEVPSKRKRSFKATAQTQAAQTQAAQMQNGKTKSSSSGRAKVLDTYTVGRFVRWLGVEKGFTFEEACDLLDALGCRTLKDPSIKWELKETRPGKPPAEVSAQHEKQLRRDHKALFKGKP